MSESDSLRPTAPVVDLPRRSNPPAGSDKRRRRAPRKKGKDQDLDTPEADDEKVEPVRVPPPDGKGRIVDERA